MALSNRDRVGKALEQLVAGLAPFVERQMQAAAGPEWLTVMQRQETSRQGTARACNLDDPRFLLRVVTEEWRHFKNVLSRGEQAFAAELREVGNRYAHEFGSSAFNEADTQRALDTMVRFLRAVGAMPEAGAVQDMLTSFQATVFEKQTRKINRESVVVAGLEGTGLKQWREVVVPHKDVREGNFNASQFAADLGNVVAGKGSIEYTDPVEFFRRTYLTHGLKELLEGAVRRLSGDTNASPVINLQTNWGGGKTHSMLALYHVCSGTPLHEYPQEVQELLEGTDLATIGTEVKRVVLVGHHLSPSLGVPKGDGTQVNTLWGELAWQLGGRTAYDTIAKADQSGTNPGSALQDLIADAAPCLILIDEWVAYARQLYSTDDLPAGTFATQFTFAQALTEAVAAVPGVMLAVSVPASEPDRGSVLRGHGQGVDSEVGGPNGQAALQQLQNAVGRVADHWRSATPEESFEIVRRRLFEEPDGSARTHIAAVARRFTQFYAEHHGEFPSGCEDTPYEARMRATYPIHPELFDRLYNDWGGLERFQRTRGVLNLMSNIIRTLWEANDPSPMIMPGTVPLAEPRVRTQFAQYLEDLWGPIIDKDVDGDNSTPAAVDNARPVYKQRSVTKRLARTIFIGSAPTLKATNKGIDQQRIWLGLGIPGDTTGHYASALHMLADRATYLYPENSRYWFDTQQTMSRTAKDLAERLRDRPEAVWAELVTRLRTAAAGPRGNFAGVHVCPDTTGDIGDEDKVRLVLLHPKLTHKKGSADSGAQQFVEDALRSKGSTQRRHQNMLVFLAPDARHIDDLMEVAREFLAWKDISDYVVERNLSPAQQKDADERRDRAAEAIRLRIGQTYTLTLVPDQPDGAKPVTITEIETNSSTSGLVERVSERLERLGKLANRHAPQNITLALRSKVPGLWEKQGHISVGELWDLYTRYCYMPRLRNREVLVRAVEDVLNSRTWAQDGFALAEGVYDGSYSGLILPATGTTFGAITDDTLLVVSDRALAQRAGEDAATERTDTADDLGGGSGGEVDQSGQSTDETGHARNQAVGGGRAPDTRFFGVYEIKGDKYGKAFKDLQLEILPHLNDSDTELEITVEIKAHRRVGFAEDKKRTVSENARVLKFDQADFEN